MASLITDADLKNLDTLPDSLKLPALSPRSKWSASFIKASLQQSLKAKASLQSHERLSDFKFSLG